MIHRFRLHSLVAALACAPLFATSALAGRSDTKAEALREQAIFEDYLNLRFADAEAKLNQAIQLCESGCANSVKARLYRDLGVVYIAGLKQRDAGVGMFVEAITMQPDIQLDPDLSSEELQAALAEARKLAGDNPKPPPEESEPQTSSEGGAAQPPPKSTTLLPVAEFDGVFHTPPEEQLVNTPLPLYVEVHDADWTAKVKAVRLNYRGFGMARFKEVEMPKLGDGYGLEITCGEIGLSPGTFEYYIVVVDEDGDAAADVGTESSPHSVDIKTEIDYSPQPLPGTEIPAQCEMPAAATSPPGMSSSSSSADEDCPPDFPGCGENSTDSGEGWGDEEDIELPEHAQYSHHWISLGGQLDFLYMHEAPDACTGNFTSELTCYEGEVYWDPRVAGRTNDFEGDGVIDGGGTTTGGLALATKRLMLGYDYALSGNFLLGARVGFAFGGGPQLVDADPATPDTNPEFFPLHAEVRGAYWFGDQALTSTVRPFLQLSGGAAQVDAGLDTEVIDLSNGRSCTPTTDPSTGQQVVTCKVPVTAWRKTGTFFVSAGAGTMIAFSKSAGLVLEARYMQMLPASGSVLGAGASMMFGF